MKRQFCVDLKNIAIIMFQIGIAVCLCLIITMQGNERAEAQQTIETYQGELIWQLRDAYTDDIIDEGETAFTLDDLIIESNITQDGQIVITKSVPLNNNFQIDLFDFVSETPLRVGNGFGLGLTSVNKNVFSWEWFDITEPGFAIKRQGSGSLNFKQERFDDLWHITRVEFLTDVVMRATKFENLDRTPRHDDWYCTIFAGSYLDWSA